MVPSTIKQASLDDAYDAALAATPTPRTLRAQLRLYETESRALIVAGGRISKTAANGHVTEFFPDLTSSMTPGDLVAMWRELINLHDEARVDLGGTPTDEAIKDRMMYLLEPIREIGPSCMAGLRC